MTPITHKLTLDFLCRGVTPRLDMMQNDAFSRRVAFTLLYGGEAFTPHGLTAAVAFRKADGTSGLYDTLPDGTPAAEMAENTVTVTLAPQVLTCPGQVEAALVLTDENLNRISAFPFEIQVAADPAGGQEVSNSYYRFTTLEQLSAAMEDFRSIRNVEINEYGELVIEFTDGVFTSPGAVSAYGIARENGFEGTQEQWLESLKGSSSAGDWTAKETPLGSYTAILSERQFPAGFSGGELTEIPGFEGFESGRTYRLTVNGEAHDVVADANGKISYNYSDIDRDIIYTVTAWLQGSELAVQVVTTADLTVTIEQPDVSYNTLPRGYLPKATEHNLGGVMVGDGLSVDERGVLSADIPSGAEWKLLKSIVLTEDTVSIFFDTDDDGNGFLCKELFFRGRTTAADGVTTTLQIAFNNKYANEGHFQGSGHVKNDGSNFAIHAQILGERYHFLSNNVMNGDINGTPANITYARNHYHTVTEITSVKLFTGSGGGFKSGSNFYIYGR